VTSALRHFYAPRGTCKRLFDTRAGEVLISGPAGTGKSRACLEKLHRMCLLNDHMRALAVRKTLVSLTATGLVTYREHVAKESIEAGDAVWFGGSRERPAAYLYTNGSTLVVGGMDDPVKVMSSEYDLAYVQEATELTADDWEKITTRLRNGRVSFQQLLADCNPDAPTHWLKSRADRGQTVMLESRHEDNPTLYHDDGTLTERGAAYIAKLDNLTGVRYQRLRKGLWVAAEGLIYEDYDPAIHLVDRFDIPPTWTRWWVVDFGYTNPFVLQCWAEDPDGRLYLYRELYHTKRTVDQHAADILTQVREPRPDLGREPHPLVHADWVWTEPKPRAIICDHDAEGRVVLSREVGIGTIAAIKTPVTAGLQVAQARLRRAGDGKPRLFVMRDSLVRRDPELADAKRPTCTAEEWAGYVWDTGGGKKIKEVPLKENDHGMDCVRYLAAARDIGSPRIRVMR
jgi:PBSX family phage terminase large subunit